MQDEQTNKNRGEKMHIGSWSEQRQNVTRAMGEGVCAFSRAARVYALKGGGGAVELN